MFKSLGNLVVKVFVNTPNVGCSNPHRVASYNFIRNKFVVSFVVSLP